VGAGRLSGLGRRLERGQAGNHALGSLAQVELQALELIDPAADQVELSLEVTARLLQ